MRPVVLSCLLVLAVAPPLGAQSSPPTWTLRTGLNGSWRPGAWMPLALEVENTGSPARGQVTIVLDATASGMSGAPGPSRLPQTTYTSALDLPAQSRKRLQFCVLGDEFKDVNIHLGPLATGRESTSRDRIAPEAILLVVAGGEEGFLRFLSGMSAGPETTVTGTQPQRIECTQIPWAKLPESWLGWDAATAVVLGDASLSSAPAAAVTALLRWVQAGGTLVVPGGSTGASLAGTALEPLLPLGNIGTRAVAGLPELTTWLGAPAPAGPVLLADGTLRPGTEVIAGSPSRSLILRRRYGSGSVLMPLFDFTAHPFKYWDQQATLWKRLLMAPVSAHPLTDTVRASGDSLAALAATTPESRLPSLWLVGTFLGAYLLMLGPVQYLVLKALDKRELAWLVTPALIVGFCIAAYLLSLGTRGRQTVTQTISVIEAGPRATVAQATSWSSIFSPTLSRYNVHFGEQVAGVRLYGGSGVSRADCLLQQDRGVTLQRIPINMWSSRTLGTVSLVDLKQGLDVQRCEWDGQRLQVKLRNLTGLRFVATAIVSRGRQSDTGALAPGGVLAHDATEITGAPLSPTVNSPGTPPPPPPTPGKPASGNSATELRRQVLDALMGPGASRYGPSGSRARGPYLIGFAEDPVVDITYDRPVRRTNLTVVAVSLPVQLPARRVLTVPSWLMQTSAPPEPQYRGSGRSEITRYRLPSAPNGARVLKLSYAASPSGPPGAPAGGPGAPGLAGPPAGGPGAPLPPGSLNAMRLYNHATHRWVDIPTGKAWHAQRPHEYFSPSGEALVQCEWRYYPWASQAPPLTCVVQTN